MAFTKTDTADIEVSCDEAKFNFPHNRSGYRKFLQFIPPKFSNLIRRKNLAGCNWNMSTCINFRYQFKYEAAMTCYSTLYSFLLFEWKILKVFLFEVGKQFFLGFNQLSKHLIEKIKTTFINPTLQRRIEVTIRNIIDAQCWGQQNFVFLTNCFWKCQDVLFKSLSAE